MRHQALGRAAGAASMAAKQKLLSPEQKLEVEAVMGQAVNFLLGSRAQIGLSPADRVAWCATHLLSHLGDCAPPPQPKEDRPQHSPTQKTLQAAEDLRRAFKIALLKAKAADEKDPPMRRIANALMQMSIAMENAATESSALEHGIAATSTPEILFDKGVHASSERARATLRDLLTKKALRVIDAFRSWDADNSGFVSRAEFCKALLSLSKSLQLNEAFDQVSANALFDGIDVDRSGSIKYKELHTALRRGETVELDPILAPGAAGEIELVALNKSTKEANVPRTPPSVSASAVSKPSSNQQARPLSLASNMADAIIAKAVRSAACNEEGSAATRAAPGPSGAAAGASAAKGQISASLDSKLGGGEHDVLGPSMEPPEAEKDKCVYTEVESLFELVRSQQAILLKATWILRWAGFHQTGLAWTRTQRNVTSLPARQEIEKNHPGAIFTLEEWQASQAILTKTLAAAVEIASDIGDEENSSLAIPLANGVVGEPKAAQLNNSLSATPVVAVSHCWSESREPDRHCNTLARIAARLAKEWNKYQMWGLNEVGVYFDYASVYQEPRSEKQQQVFEAALANSALWFGHDLVTVYLLTDSSLAAERTSATDSGRSASPDGLASDTTTSSSKKKMGGLSSPGALARRLPPPGFEDTADFSALDAGRHLSDFLRCERGWPLFEEALARGLKNALKAPATSESRQAQKRYTLPGKDEPVYFWRKVSDLSVETNLDVLAKTYEVPPLPPSFMAMELAKRHFSTPSDRPILIQRYADALKEGLQGVTSMCFRDAGFSDDEVEALALALSESNSVSCTFIDLASNAFSTRGLEMLAKSPCAGWLTQLALSLNPRIVTLPSSFCSALPKLTLLDLSSCRKLRELPEGVGALASLEALSIRACPAITKIPDSLGNLRQLRVLDLRQCSGLVEVPQTMSKILSLRDLPLDGCDEIVALPDLSRLPELRVGKLPKRLSSWDTGGRVAFDFRRTGKRRAVM